MKTCNDYNESNKRTPPVFPDYTVEAVIEDNHNFADISCFTLQNNSKGIVEVHVDE